jgi:hypothetical protein
MRIRIEVLKEPELQFGKNVTGWEPKKALVKGGPFFTIAETRPIRLGLVALSEEIDPVRAWFRRMEGLVLSSETNVRRFREFPGTKQVFNCRYELADQFLRCIDGDNYRQLAALPAHDRFEYLLDLFASRIETLFGDVRPDCVLVCLPEELAELRISNPKLSWQERVVLERLQKEEDDEQLSLFAPTPEELRLAAELRPQAEELLFRNFYRALKARCMNHQNPVPIQVLRRQTYISSEALQSDATRAWNLSVSLYYKSGHIPWRPYGLIPGSCFVGISFHHLKRRGGDLIYASLAQAFSNDVEPFALQGGAIPQNQTRNRQPYLTEQQAADLIHRVVEGYEDRTGSRPSRVIVHKTSRYQQEEELGFRESLLADVAGCELVWFTPTGFRLLRRGMHEPWRGTLCTIGEGQHYLFTTGFVPAWDEYPGPHIPAPLQIGAAGETDIKERAREILALTKMNWNNADGMSRHPITISFARKVGTIMTEMPDDAVPNPLYRFYM